MRATPCKLEPLTLLQRRLAASASSLATVSAWALQQPRRWSCFTAALLAAALGGCTGGVSLGGSTAGPASTAAVRNPAPADLAGRWTLASASGQSCGVNLTSGASEGAIRPEGGCPGNFFTSRKWTYEGNQLVLRDHNGAPLGQMRLASAGRYEGESSSGQPITLSR